uniref:Uncharacterized protein n=1 Tax=Anguilla anguilla TaxID=7936 RepID=A0A0E9XTH1_ANGAN
MNITSLESANQTVHVYAGTHWYRWSYPFPDPKQGLYGLTTCQSQMYISAYLQLSTSYFKILTFLL